MPIAWGTIEQDARAEGQRELERGEANPLVFGEPVAWATNRHGMTDGLSPVHRVGFPLGAKPYTACSELIPEPVTWLVLSPRLVERMPKCPFCAAEMRRIERARLNHEWKVSTVTKEAVHAA